MVSVSVPSAVGIVSTPSENATMPTYRRMPLLSELP